MTACNAHGKGADVRLRCCLATSCSLQGAEALLETLREGSRQADTDRNGPFEHGRTLEIRRVGCLGLCGRGPLLAVDGGPGQGLYGALSPEQVAPLLTLLNADTATGAETLQAALLKLQPQRLDPELPFFRHQRPLVLQHCGWIDPEQIDSALAAGSYQQLLRCLDEHTPAEVRQRIRRSGLRGRGGAGFPTGLKWERVAAEPAEPRFVVANGDEGDPGAFMDRTVMESDPHRLLEGLLIAGYAVGACRGVVFVRAEYPLAVARLRRAIAEAEARGLLGEAVAGRRFRFRISLRVGAGAYVCGEETALMAAIEGRRGLPHPRPPYPAQRGLWQQPTLINNVETLAAVPAILAIGPEAYAALGHGCSRGTKVLSLSGAIRHCGVVEVPLGLSLRELVETIGAGAPEGQRIKAVQTGGPTGGFIAASDLDTPLDYEAFAARGSALGSGGLVVIGDHTPIPELVLHGLRFCANESCGRCVPCRAGTRTLVTLLEQLQAGGGDRGAAHALALIEELAAMVRAASLCGLGQGAVNPLLNSLNRFRSDYTAAPDREVGP